jgi:hypothetical protein
VYEKADGLTGNHRSARDQWLRASQSIPLNTEPNRRKSIPIPVPISISKRRSPNKAVEATEYRRFTANDLPDGYFGVELKQRHGTPFRLCGSGGAVSKREKRHAAFRLRWRQVVTVGHDIEKGSQAHPFNRRLALPLAQKTSEKRGLPVPR